MLNSELPSRSLPVVITEASVCIALCIVSIIGNSLVCIAAYRNSNLRSTTNLYIIALAVSDLLCGIVQMPLTSATLIIGRWVFGDALCQFEGFVSVFTYYVTPATLGLTALNRYMKIVKTSHYKKIFSPRRSKIWLSCLWLSFALYLLIVRVTNWIKIDFIQDYAVCSFDYPTSESQIFHYCITVGLLFVLPLCVGIFSYYKIFLKTNKHQRNVVSSLRNCTNITVVSNSLKENKSYSNVAHYGGGIFVLLDTNVGTCPLVSFFPWDQLKNCSIACHFFILFECFNQSYYLRFHKWRVPKGISQTALLPPWKVKNCAKESSCD